MTRGPVDFARGKQSIAIRANLNGIPGQITRVVVITMLFKGFIGSQVDQNRGIVTDHKPIFTITFETFEKGWRVISIYVHQHLAVTAPGDLKVTVMVFIMPINITAADGLISSIKYFILVSVHQFVMTTGDQVSQACFAGLVRFIPPRIVPAGISVDAVVFTLTMI